LHRVIDLSRLSAPLYPEIFSSDDDPRLGQLIGAPSAVADADVVLLGVPTDEGIVRNGGRPGASAAPAAIRTALARLTPFAGPQFKEHVDRLKIADIGDVATGPLEKMHDVAQQAVAELIRAGKIVIVLGGGHDITFPCAKGLREGHTGDMGVINIDAHLDVRPRKNGLHHSGSSFRLLVEENVISGRSLVEIGVQSFAISKAHFDWVKSIGGRIVTFEDANEVHLPHAYEEYEFGTTFGDPETAIYLSFDIDCVRASDAPGVSAPTPTGFLAEEVYELSVAAGLSQHVKVFDIVELNPTFDLDNRTARLAARMIAGFLAGVANRRRD
jgi:formimidoylglutamase